MIHAWGGPLVYEERPRPIPRAGEVLVAVRACGVGLTVLNCIQGNLGRPDDLPRVPGHEITGIVAETGPGVRTVRPGDRVMAFFYLTCGCCEPCRAGRDSMCRYHGGYVGVHRDGGYAEYVALPEANALPLPDGISFVEATAIPDAIATPYHVCASRAEVRVGDRVLIVGAGGGVGIHMVQMARLFGADVVAVDVDDGKLERCRALGAAHAVDFRAADAEARAREALGGGATVAVDLVGSEATLEWACRLLGPAGRMVLLTTFPGVGLRLEPRRMVMGELTVSGSRYCGRAEVLAAARLVAAGRILPVVSAVRPLAEAGALHALLREARCWGAGRSCPTRDHPSRLPGRAGGDVMRAMVVERYGEPLRMAELPMPSPAPGEVLIRVLGCGVCRSDLKVADGAMPFSATLRLPHVPGHEISGEIAALGPGARGRIGDRVLVYHYWACGRCAHCQAGEENLCLALRGWAGFTSPGGFQEYLAAPDDRVLPLPANVRPEHAGPLTCALGTAYHAVVTRGGVRAGETVAILGAGGVGLHAVQVACASGARSLAVDLQPHRLEAARALGAEDAVRAGDEAAPRVREATGGRGADLVVDTVGHRASLLAAASLARRGGRIVLVGYTARAEEYPPLPAERAVLDEISVIGSRYATRRELARALDLAARGLVRPVVSAEVPLARANDAFAMVREDRSTGRVIVRVAEACST